LDCVGHTKKGGGGGKRYQSFNGGPFKPLGRGDRICSRINFKKSKTWAEVQKKVNRLRLRTVETSVTFIDRGRDRGCYDPLPRKDQNQTTPGKSRQHDVKENRVGVEEKNYGKRAGVSLWRKGKKRGGPPWGVETVVEVISHQGVNSYTNERRKGLKKIC